MSRDNLRVKQRPSEETSHRLENQAWELELEHGKDRELSLKVFEPRE